MSLAPGDRLGPYEIVAFVGAGGMGEVFRARDTRLHRDVAVKVLAPAYAGDRDRLRRFEQEARAAAALDHPNILIVHDVGRKGGCAYIVTEFLDGQDLRRHLVNGALPVARAVEVGLQIARGLAAAHDKGIVHRDLKPENVFLVRDGQVKILDFGLARLSPPPAEGGLSSENATASAAGRVLGTVGYMSPEQVRGEEADSRSDVFSLGAILFEALCGRRAFQEATPVDTLHATLHRDPPSLAEGRAELATLERVVRRCLEKEPRHRFQSARDLAFALETPGRAEGRATADGRDPPRAVAVLPFKGLTGEGASHLGLGLADATITELATSKNLIVRPTSAVLGYEHRLVEPQRAGRELGVDAVVDGRYQRSGSRVRVTVQVVRTDDGQTIWAGKIDAPIEDTFAVQDAVARRVADALQVELGSPGRPAPPAGSGRAYELYLQGRVHLWRGDSLDGLNSAIECFEKARALQPDLAVAWVGLADAYVRMAFTFDPEGDWHARAEEMCARALALDPLLAQGHYLRGRLLWSPRGGFQHGASLRALGAAVRAQPNLNEGHHWLGIVLMHVGLFDEAEEAFARALAISPEDLVVRQNMPFARYHRGRFQEALALCEDVQPRGASAWLAYEIALCHLHLGRADAASETIERAARVYPDEVLVHPVRGLVAALRGDEAEARRQIEHTVSRERAFGHYHHAQYDVACIEALLGRTEAALQWLSASAGNGYPCAAFFAIDPFLRSLQGTEGFRDLVAALTAECEGYRRVHQEARSSLTPPWAPRAR